jgi:hypothetical protein
VRSVNLVLFGNHEKGTLRELGEAARLISERHPEIHAVALTTKARVRRAARLAALAARPTLSVELERIRFPAPFRGVRLNREKRFSKLDELKRLAALDIPVPRWTVIAPGTVLDHAKWGPYVVVKPTNAQRGAKVVIQRTGRVRYKAPEELEPGHPGRQAPLIAQEFIYTGPYPISHRIITFLGRPICAYRYTGRREAALEDRSAFKRIGGGYNIVASAVGCTAEPFADPDILALASRASAAFPSASYLGVDIVRDVDSGKLYVLETNPTGYSWPFDAPTAKTLEHVFGYHPRDQFGAVERIAEAAADDALRLAA